MSAEKLDLARAGTMQVTAQEGKVFLDKNLTEWKKPYLADHFEDGEEEEEEAPAPRAAKGKGKLAKHTTMKGTAKEAAALLGEDRPDPDAATRGQQKKLDEISSPPPAKRSKKSAAASSLSKANTINKTLAEAKELYGDLDMSEGRSLRKRPAAAKTPMKKAGTMVKTAKEGKAYLKREKKAAKKKAAAADEENGEADSE